MRDLTKSMTSYTWATSLFWTQQMLNFVGLGATDSSSRCAKSFENVTEVTADQMNEATRAVFRSGDTLQRGMVDLLFAPFNLGNWCGGSGGRDGRGRDADWNCGGWTETAARTAAAGVDAMQGAVGAAERVTRRAVDAVTSSAQRSSTSASDDSEGWGDDRR